MVSVRPSFGIRGSYWAAFLNIIQLIGWTAVMLIVCGQAADTISKFYGFSNPTLWILLSEDRPRASWVIASGRAAVIS
jgi:purine-cytosine permease-like protein